LRLSLALQLVSGSKKGQRTLAIQIARAAGLKLFCAFSPSEKRFAFLRRPQITLEAFSMMGEAFTMRDISHGKNPSRKFYSQNLDQYDSFAKLGIRKQPQIFYQKTRSRRTHRTCPRSAISARPHFPLEEPSSGRPLSAVPRQQKKASSMPTCPSVSRNAIKSSERIRMRIGAQSGFGGSRERATGSQKRRNKSPIGVPGPVRQSSSFSSFEIIGASSLESQIGSCVVVRVVRPDEVGAQTKQRAV